MTTKEQIKELELQVSRLEARIDKARKVLASDRKRIRGTELTHGHARLRVKIEEAILGF